MGGTSAGPGLSVLLATSWKRAIPTRLHSSAPEPEPELDLLDEISTVTSNALEPVHVTCKCVRVVSSRADIRCVGHDSTTYVCFHSVSQGCKLFPSRCLIAINK